MPQLDLTWFLFNFSIAWLLVLVVLLALSKQNWKTASEQETSSMEKNTPSSTQWRW
uniref:ATP synthase F0 subunit 8 n=1 Tax=Bohadschia argus TaxID=240130 RepID=UPI001F13FA1E|nr:ATP synthase F0 subunit 8 [Bohadschia argus]UMI33339.1 ATP synthase F0 subunit 8 [Bohadschia argus]